MHKFNASFMYVEMQNHNDLFPNKIWSCFREDSGGRIDLPS